MPHRGSGDGEPARPPTHRHARRVALTQVRHARQGQGEEGEWLELFNPGDEPVDLGGWRLVDGVALVFEAGTLLPAGGYLVISADGEPPPGMAEEVAVLVVCLKYQVKVVQGVQNM